MTKVARGAKAADSKKKDGWFLHFREKERQWELHYRSGPGKWRSHRIPRTYATELQATKYAEGYVGTKRRNGTLADPHLPEPKVEDGITFARFAEEWIDGTLTKRHPDHVRAKKNAKDDADKLAVLAPAIGHIPIRRFTLDDADAAMRRLDELRQAKENRSAYAKGKQPKKLKPVGATTRRSYAQFLHKALGLAVYPCRLIEHHPLPKGFLPKPDGAKPLGYLFPDEDAALLGCARVPLGFRVFYGFAIREGMRASELFGTTWGDVDLVRGAVSLPTNKTDDPRAWALNAGVAAALTEWRKRLDANGVAVGPDDPVFVCEDGTSINPFNAARFFRQHLLTAGVNREEILAGKKGRMPIRFHDTRATFVTLSLAAGKTEAWVVARTGHRSSQMIARYRRAAQTVEELSLGAVLALDEAIPELRAPKKPTPAAAEGDGEGVAAEAAGPSVAASAASGRKRTKGPVHPLAQVAPDAARHIAELVAVAISRRGSGRRNPGKTGSRFRDLNSRPTVYETVALPLS